jgi:hypothetical protein
MSDDSYDGSVFVSRRLTEDEIRELRITLLPYFHVSGGLGAEDIADFLDYTFAMISNTKTVDYVIEELIGMEMDFCTEQVAKKVGKELATFIIKISGEGGGEEGEEPSNPQDEEAGADAEADADDSKADANADSKGPRVKSLKVNPTQTCAFCHSIGFSPIRSNLLAIARSASTTVLRFRQCLDYGRCVRSLS